MEIFDSVLDMIGNTPLVNLKQVAKDKPCRVVVKAEMVNPGGSSKDRPAVTMIDHAERECAHCVQPLVVDKRSIRP